LIPHLIILKPKYAPFCHHAHETVLGKTDYLCHFTASFESNIYICCFLPMYLVFNSLLDNTMLLTVKYKEILLAVFWSSVKPTNVFLGPTILVPVNCDQILKIIFLKA
jgi:hypothetical protein